MLYIPLLLVLPFAVGATQAEDLPEPMELGDFILIAHRGVVTDTIPENSLLSLEETIRRGYTHIEVDLRSTKDGHAVCLHDHNLLRAVGRPDRIGDLTLEELREIAPLELVPDFATFCERSAGRIGLMVDIKEWHDGVEEAFARSIEEPMLKHGLMEDSYFIGRRALTEHFSERGRLSWRAPLEEVKASDRILNPDGTRYFMFGRGEQFDAESVRGYQALGLKVIVTINTFHYLRLGDWQELGDRDVVRMLEYGVDGLQIDCVYEPAFRAHIARYGLPGREAREE